MRCKYWDCGWCYAPDGKNANDDDGKCEKPDECEELKAQESKEKELKQ